VDKYEKTKHQKRDDQRGKWRWIRYQFVKFLGFLHKVVFSAQLPCFSLIAMKVVAEQNAKQENSDRASN
jgi:hypothetical protein